ncbi:MAG: UDP-2,3-diacylglucosamine diphosphatase [Paludibacterium sp.]|uniref:UDP-2,3-diacylglucosamine diphosphatase n=1 Tax=Paludibacterium sp. TaxID=1917523 RepID=UPI0025D8AD84|nr:UDP-2,3-diacylglucosamine diphosphatase [Paludibacterium sp.]MBV8049522.1 UDP-2,3-diacylglucosamine diphosphatase [Paludibacterium sp.]MBV8646217.1 UDP-2,3-diacylglucosamine diphosphatase [Paludibacterium sp.]
MAIHLISDLHLSDDTPELTALFLGTLQAWQGQLDALYILGDLFEYWVGDDDDSPFLRDTLAAMRAFADKTPLYVMHGNRDFLLGEGFARASGARLLSDPHPLVVGGARYLLSHGDALCTDDTAYQQFRAQSRSPAWQQAMLARPLAERHLIARMARQESEAAKRQTGLTAISDVTDAAVLALLDAHGWPVLVHGHTHRPAVHVVERGERQTQRWVIADWHDGQGGYLAIDGHGIGAHALP